MCAKSQRRGPTLETPSPRGARRPARGGPAARRSELLAIPIDGERAGDEGVVVLKELPIGDKDLPEVRDLLDPWPDLAGLRLARDSHEVTRVEGGQRALDRS